MERIGSDNGPPVPGTKVRFGCQAPVPSHAEPPMRRVLASLLLLVFCACRAEGDTGPSDTASARSTADAPWVTVHGLEWKRQGPTVAVRFQTDAPVRTRVCDDTFRCVPGGAGTRHGVILATASSTLTIEVEAEDGALAVFGPYAVSEN